MTRRSSNRRNTRRKKRQKGGALEGKSKNTLHLHRSLSRSSSDELTPFPSPSPNVGYNHPVLGRPDEDFELLSTNMFSRNNLRIAVYKNTDKSQNSINIINTTPIRIQNVLINGRGYEQGDWRHANWRPNRRVISVVEDGFIIFKPGIHTERDDLGNLIIMIECDTVKEGSNSPMYTFAFNIPDSDFKNISDGKLKLSGYPTYLIYQNK